MNSRNLDFLATLESVIVERLETPTEESYTSGLAALGPKRMAQKVGEEAVEVALAAVDGSREEIVNETADLIYHLLVLLNSQDIRFADVVAVLQSRHPG